jgi:hypothetical protein
MLKERLTNLFKQYDPAVRAVIVEIGEIEQRYISMKTHAGLWTILTTRSPALPKRKLLRKLMGRMGNEATKN